MAAQAKWSSQQKIW